MISNQALADKSAALLFAVTEHATDHPCGWSFTPCRAAAGCGSTCANGAIQTERPILFIYGWSQSHLCWERQVKSALRDEFRLVALDLRGHGMSEPPPRSQH